MANGEKYVIEVRLTRATLWEFVGSWKVLEGSVQLKGETSGRVAASNSVSGDESHLTLKNSLAILDRGYVWFPRPTRGLDGTTSTINSKNNASRFLTKDGWKKFDGTVTLVSR